MSFWTDLSAMQEQMDTIDGEHSSKPKTAKSAHAGNREMHKAGAQTQPQKNASPSPRSPRSRDGTETPLWEPSESDSYYPVSQPIREKYTKHKYEHENAANHGHANNDDTHNEQNMTNHANNGDPRNERSRHQHHSGRGPPRRIQSPPESPYRAHQPFTDTKHDREYVYQSKFNNERRANHHQSRSGRKRRMEESEIPRRKYEARARDHEPDEYYAVRPDPPRVESKYHQEYVDHNDAYNVRVRHNRQSTDMREMAETLRRKEDEISYLKKELRHERDRYCPAPVPPQQAQYEPVQQNTAPVNHDNNCDPCKIEPIDCSNLNGSARMRRLEESLKRKDSEIASLKQELRERDFALENVRQTVEDLEMRLDGVTRLQEDNRRLQSRYKQASTRLTNITREMAETKTALYAAQQHISELKNNVLNLGNDCRRYQRERTTEVNAAKHAAQREIACLQEEYEAIICDLEQKLRCKDKSTREITEQLTNMTHLIQTNCHESAKPLSGPCGDDRDNVKSSKDSDHDRIGARDGNSAGKYSSKIWEPNAPH